MDNCGIKNIINTNINIVISIVIILLNNNINLRIPIKFEMIIKRGEGWNGSTKERAITHWTNMLLHGNPIIGSAHKDLNSCVTMHETWQQLRKCHHMCLHHYPSSIVSFPYHQLFSCNPMPILTTPLKQQHKT